MTDKEQIMIDGVNIIDCNDYYVEQETDQVKCDLSGEYCRENKNCFYKQLLRKEQECEELKKRLMQKSEVDMFFNTPIEGWSNDPCGICPHKAENEELKKELNGSEKWRIKAESLNEKLELNNDRYRKALEEIEGIAKNFGSYAAWQEQRINKILDIINKAKGEE